MLESLKFHYDGLSSEMFGVYNVQTDSNLFEEIFLPTRELKKEKIDGRDKSYHFGEELEDITIPLSFLLPHNYTDKQLRQIKRWLFQPYYREFYFDDFPEKIFYVMYSGDFKLRHNGAGQGYVTLTMESNSPFVYSPFYDTHGKIRVNDTVNGVSFEFDNQGDFPILPEIWITNHGHDTITIVNKRNNEVFEFTGMSLTGDERIYIDNKEKYIETDLPLTYRYDNFNNNWLQLDEGNTLLQMYGNFDIEFKYQFIYLP